VVENVAQAGRLLKQSGLPLIERPSVVNGDAGRWLVHPRAANGVMVEGIEEWGRSE
jgi:hypothetical protein